MGACPGGGVPIRDVTAATTSSTTKQNKTKQNKTAPNDVNDTTCLPETRQEKYRESDLVQLMKCANE